MSISDQQFLKLQQLSAIRLDPAEHQMIQKDLGAIIGLLQKLDELDIDMNAEDTSTPVAMHISSGVAPFANTQGLLDNVQHDLSGDAIVIKSFRK